MTYNVFGGMLNLAQFNSVHTNTHKTKPIHPRYASCKYCSHYTTQSTILSWKPTRRLVTIDIVMHYHSRLATWHSFNSIQPIGVISDSHVTRPYVRIVKL